MSPPQEAAAFTFVAPRGTLDWRSSEVLGIDPAVLLHPRGVSEDQLSALAHASATLRHTRLEGDPRQSDGVNAARFLRVAQLLQLAAQWEEATYSRDSDEAQRHIQELQSRLDSLERVRPGLRVSRGVRSKHGAV